MSGQIVKISDGEEVYEGYMAVPASGSGPGVIVIQEWWGLVPHIKDVADRYAAAGFVALAPDLYRGKTTDEPDEAASLMMALHIGETYQILSKAIEMLIAHPSTSTSKVGIVGFCMGGQLSLYAACENSDIAACIDYYGIHPNIQPVLRDLYCPLLGFFAENDNYAGPEQVKALDAELSTFEKEFQFVTYPGTSHAFFNDVRPAYNAEAAADTWRRSLEFFTENLS